MALSRGGALLKRDQHVDQQNTHMPSAARGFNLLDSPESYWKNGYCPYESPHVGVAGKFVIERIDAGSSFYKNHFYGQGKLKYGAFLINFGYF